MAPSNPTTIYTELNASWNATRAGIAKPTFREVVGQPTHGTEWFNQAIPQFPHVVIQWNQCEFPIETLDKTENMQNHFTIVLIARTWADCNLLLAELREIINGKAISEGDWHIDKFTPFQSEAQHVYYAYICELTEELWE